MHLVIDRSKWLRGTKLTWLLDPEGEGMCCLGFFGLLLGATPDQIRGFSTPDGCPVIAWPEEIPYFALMDVNDSRDIDDAEREELITNYFAPNGVTVEFV